MEGGQIQVVCVLLNYPKQESASAASGLFSSTSAKYLLWHKAQVKKLILLLIIALAILDTHFTSNNCRPLWVIKFLNFAVKEIWRKDVSSPSLVFSKLLHNSEPLPHKILTLYTRWYYCTNESWWAGVRYLLEAKWPYKASCVDKTLILYQPCVSSFFPMDFWLLSSYT